MVEWNEWKKKRVEKMQTDKHKAKTVIVTLKEKEKGTISNLVEEFHKELITCCIHLFNIKHQYRAIRSLKENLSEHDIILHVDFSENYKCKYDSEIQSMHFGASQRQISLHTGMLYTKQKTNGFCSISDCLQHGPAGIWAHLTCVDTCSTEIRKSTKCMFLAMARRCNIGVKTTFTCCLRFQLN